MHHERKIFQPIIRYLARHYILGKRSIAESERLGFASQTFTQESGDRGISGCRRIAGGGSIRFAC